MTKQTESNLVKVLNVLAKEPNQACKEALDEELTAKLDKDKARDGDCCTEGCIKCDARKILAETQD